MDDKELHDLIKLLCSQLNRDEWLYWAGYLLDNCELQPEMRKALAATRDSLNFGLLEYGPKEMTVH